MIFCNIFDNQSNYIKHLPWTKRVAWGFDLSVHAKYIICIKLGGVNTSVNLNKKLKKKLNIIGIYYNLP